VLDVKVTGTATAVQSDSFDRGWQQELKRMGHVSRERDWQVLQDERRRMLEHLLEVSTAACRPATTNSPSFHA
jgi:hypothetical protein